MSGTPAGTPGGNGAPAPAGTATPNVAQPQGEQWKDFATALDRLGNSLGGKLDTLSQGVQNADKAAADRAAADEAARVAAAAQAVRPPDYEAMTNSELAAHIQSTLSASLEGAIEKALKPLLGNLQQVQTAQFRSDGERQVEALRSGAKDFDDWRDDMAKVLTQHPSFNLKDAYDWVKLRNPEKAKQLDEKYNPKPPPPPKLWGGMTPGYGSAEGGSKILSKDEAGREAYREVAAKYPGLLRPLDEL